MLRGTASHAVLALAAAAVLSGSAWAVDAGQSVNISTLGSSATINGGTVVIDASNSFGTNFTLNDIAGNTIDSKGATATLSGKFTGSGGITITNSVAGTGVLKLTNSGNDYTGITTINSGATLALFDSDTTSDTNATSGTIAHSQQLVNNGTFDISGAVNGISLIALSGSGNIVLGSNMLTLYDYDSVSAKTYPTNTTFSGVISGTGSFVLSEGEITLTGVNTFTGATTVSNGTLHLSGNGSVSQSASVVVYSTFDLTKANSAVFKSLSGSGTVNLGANDLVLNAASGSFSGIITGTGKLILNGGTEWIGGTTSFTQVVINAGTFQAGSDTVTYNVANGTAFAFYSNNAQAMSGVISGAGTVTKYGSGVATISTAQTYTGATVISAGTIKLTGNGSLALSSGIQVDSILDLTESNAASITAVTGIGIVRLGTQSLTITNGNGDFSGGITGSGGVTIAGGTQSLSGANTYTGQTSVTGGTLVLVAGASLKSTVALSGSSVLNISSGVITSGTATINSLSGTGTVNLGANTLILAAAAASDNFSGTISGSGGVTLNAGTATLSGTSNYTGTTTVAAGTLKLTGSLAGTSKLNVSGTFDATGAADPTLTFVSLAGSGAVNLGTHALVLNTVASANNTFSGIISGSSSLTVKGPGTQVLSGTNTYTGGTIVGSGATLQIGSGSTTGSIVGDVTDNGTLKFYRQDSSVFGGKISGSGAVIQAGIGTTILTADNDYTGGTTINSGTLQIGDGTHANGSITGDITDNGTLAFARTGTTLINAKVTGAGNLSISNGTIQLTGVSDYTGQTRINAGAELDLVGTGAIAASNQVTVNGAFDISGTSGASIISLTGGATGAVNLGAQSLTLTAANATFAGSISGTGGGLIINSGSETLSGASTYSGATIVRGVSATNGGALVVTGSIANSAVDVKSYGTLSGTGTIGALTVESGGTLKAGLNGAGTLTATGPVSLAAGSIYAVDVTSAGAAKFVTSGTASLNGSLAITSSDGTYDLGNRITILTAAGGITGKFSTTSVDLFTAANGSTFTSKVAYTNSAVTLEVDLAKLSTALGTGATINQKAVAGGIDKAIAAGSTVPIGFEMLGNDTADVLVADTTELAGEIGADTPLVAKSLFTPFLDAMSERTAMLRPLRKGQTRPLEAWISGYGGTNIVDGDVAGTGAHKFRANVQGAVAGVQWAPWTNTLIGGAISVGTSDFHIAENLGKGTATSIEAGVYGYVQASRHIYSSFAAGVSGTQIKTTRVITVSGADTLTGKLTTFTLGGRYEAGIQLPWFTPYVGVQDHVTMLPGYTEGVATGSATTYALKYDSRTYNSGRAEVGLRHFIDIEVTPRWILTPDFTIHLNDRLAYAYDLSDGSKTGALFSALPSSDFTVFGAKAGRHAALATVGADVLFDNGLRLTTHIDTTFSKRSEAFTGFAGIGYTW